MNQLYHAECPELGCMDVFAADRDEAIHLVKVYLTFNFAEKVEYRVGNAIDPMLLDRKARSMLMDAAGRDTKGFGVLKEDGWKIIPVWDYPFPEK